MALYVVLIGYTRMFLGAHSLDQVLYGCQMGVWLGVSIHYCLKEYLDQVVDGLLLNTAKNLGKLLIGSTSLFVLCLGLELLSYAIISPNVVILDKWKQNMVSKCGS